MVAYANSKSANVLFVRELSKRLQGSSVLAVGLEPGVIPTQLSRHLGCVGSVFRAGLGKLLFSSQWKNEQQGAATTVYACVAPELKAGAYLKNCGVEAVTHAECLDDALAARLWQARCPDPAWVTRRVVSVRLQPLPPEKRLLVHDRTRRAHLVHFGHWHHGAVFKFKSESHTAAIIACRTVVTGNLILTLRPDP
mmetsp:Transcript_40349/g.81329  ORF Transcript_40349/g.81329 Transcript_40349/m.81329 type:complete len:195 (-) Transcript_40349:282-866(-)